MSALVHYFTRMVEQHCEKHKSWVSNAADPTQNDRWTAYLSLDHGFETPEAGKHNGEVCTECGQVVTEDRCFCSDYCYPMPNFYEVVVTIPCWVTDIEIRAKSGEVYRFVWDNGNPGAWCGSTDAELAEKVLDRFLSSYGVIDEKTFREVDPCNCEEPDFDYCS